MWTTLIFFQIIQHGPLQLTSAGPICRCLMQIVAHFYHPGSWCTIQPQFEDVLVPGLGTTVCKLYTPENVFDFSLKKGIISKGNFRFHLPTIDFQKVYDSFHGSI